MRVWRSYAAIVVTAVVACTGGASSAQAPPPAPGLKLSQFDTAQFCDLAVGPDGTLHAVFTETVLANATKYLYYRMSTDGGRTWSVVKNLSDDESGRNASYARVIADARGRVYVVWKYLERTLLQDGPGGTSPGDLTFRAAEGGAWSPRIPLGDDKVPTFSWFAAKDPAGAVHVIWSQTPRDAALAAPNSGNPTGGLIRQVRLNAATPPAPIDLIVPKPLLTPQEQQAMKAAGHYPELEDTQPRKVGLINLRGYVDAAGKAHFVAEDPGVTDGPMSQQVGHRLVLWNGSKLTKLLAYDLTQQPNYFENPPILVVDAQGQEHLIRMPPKTATPTVRDYPVQNGALGDPTDILAPSSPRGAITGWQAWSLPGGQLAVTAAVSEKGEANKSDLELLVSIRDAAGRWSSPLNLTNNVARQTVDYTRTGPGGSVARLVNYRPRFAAVILDADGQPCVLMVNSADSSLAVGSPGGSSEGRNVSVVAGAYVDTPMVFFRRWSPQ